MSMGTPEIGCIDRAEVLLHRMAQDPLVEKSGCLVQQIVLLDHVLGFEHGSGKHELPMDRHALAFEGHDIELFRVVDDRQMALRRDGFSDRGPMVAVRLATRSTVANPASTSASFKGCRWSMTRWAPISAAQARLSGRAAVAMTVSPVNWRAS